MMSFDTAQFARRWPLLGLAALLVLAAILALALTGTGPAGAQNDGLRVSISADPTSPANNESVTLTANIENAPEGASPAYAWRMCADDGDFCMDSNRYPLGTSNHGFPEWDFTVTVSYPGGVSATSDVLTVRWGGVPTPTPTPVPPTPTPTPVPPTPTPPPPQAPEVFQVEVVSEPVEDDTYVLGDIIQIEASFTDRVTVTGTPQLKIDMDPAHWGTKVVDYASGSGSNSLLFEHEVVEPNYSTRGIAVLRNSLRLNGGTIRSTSSAKDAELAHAGLDHDPKHKVNWKLTGCVRVAPSTVSAIGIEKAALISWTMPAQNADDCTVTGFVVEARGRGFSSLWFISDITTRSYETSALSAGEYDFSVYVQYGSANSEPRSDLSQAVPNDCSVTLTASSSVPYQVMGTWTNASSAWGCEAGGVYVEWKKASASEWMSSFRVSNPDEKFKRFNFGDLDTAEYQFRVRTIDARGIGKSEMEDAWVRTSNTVSLTPQGVFSGKPRVWMSDIDVAAGKVKRLSRPKTSIQWNTPSSTPSLDSYRIRYRALEDDSYVELDITAHEIGEVLDQDTTGYTLEGLERTKQYWIQVGIDVTENGVTTTEYGSPVLASFSANRFEATWGLAPTINTGAGVMFIRPLANHTDASGICYLNGGDINCPPGTIIHTKVHEGGRYHVYAVASIAGLYAVSTAWKADWLSDGVQTSPGVVDIQAPPPDGPGNIVIKSNNSKKAKVTWDVLPDISATTGYRFRHRKRGTEAWTTQTLTASTKEVILTGLEHHTAYDVQVGACIHTCHDDDDYFYSKVHGALGVHEDYRLAWWYYDTPFVNYRADRMFVRVNDNTVPQSTVCKLTQAGGTPSDIPCNDLTSLDVTKVSPYLVTAEVTTPFEVQPATLTTPAVFEKISPPPREYVDGYHGSGQVVAAGASGGNGKIAVSWYARMNYPASGHTFTRNGKTYKIKQRDSDTVAYRPWHVFPDGDAREDTWYDLWKEVRVPADTNYYEITGLAAGFYQIQVWACVGTIEVDSSGNEVTGAELQQCAVNETTATSTIDSVQHTVMTDDPGRTRGMSSVDLHATVAAANTDLPGSVWDPSFEKESGGSRMNVYWGPAIPVSKTATLHYEVRYRATDETAWTSEIAWAPNIKHVADARDVTVWCAKTGFNCGYVRQLTTYDPEASKEYEVEVRARNVNGYGPWVPAVKK